MPEETKERQEVEELEENEEVQQEPDQQPEGEEQPEELSASEEPTEEELPEDTKARTREQFEKLKQHNADLKKQLEERQSLPSVVDFLNSPMPQVTPEALNRYQPQQPTPQQQPQTPEQALLDENGYVNADVLSSKLSAAEAAQRKAEEAERRAMEAEQRIARFEQDAETKQLYAAYPELDPMNENFNRDAYDLVRKEITDQIVSSGKRDSMAAAERMSKYFRKSEPKPPQPSKAVEQRNLAQSSGKSTRRQSSESLQDLKARHDDQAIAERLRRLGL